MPLLPLRLAWWVALPLTLLQSTPTLAQHEEELAPVVERYWTRGAAAVQPRRFTKRRAFEIAGHVGIIPNDAFVIYFPLGLRLTSIGLSTARQSGIIMRARMGSFSNANDSIEDTLRRNPVIESIGLQPVFTSNRCRIYRKSGIPKTASGCKFRQQRPRQSFRQLSRHRAAAAFRLLSAS